VTTILLARHGESDWNAAGRWQGHTDRPLTELGRSQAGRLRDELAGVCLDAVYASDLRRAWETAEIAVEGRGLHVVREPALREVDVGSWAGRSRAELEELDPDGVRRWESGGLGWEGGEAYEAMAGRVVECVLRVAGAHPGGRLLVVSHGGSIRAVKAAAAGLTFHEYRRLHPVEPNAALSRVSVENGTIRLVT
jgi:probable phosphoglycerate mutase